MPWDAGSAMDRLGTSVRGLADLRQRKRESNRAMLMGLLGQGADIWKTVYGAKQNKELAQQAPMWQAEADLKVLGQQHANEMDKLKQAHGWDLEVMDKEQADTLAQIDRDYLYRIQMADRAADREDALLKAKAQYEMDLEAARQRFQGGENALDRKSALEQIWARAAADKSVNAAKGVSSNALEMWDSMMGSAFSQAKLMGILTMDEMGNEVLSPDNVEKFKSFLAIPPGLSPADAQWLQGKVDSLIAELQGIEVQDNPPQAAPATRNWAPAANRPAAPPSGSATQKPTINAQEQQTNLAELWDLVGKLKQAGGNSQLVADMQSAATDLGSGRVFTLAQMNNIRMLLDRAKQALNPSASGATGEQLLGLPAGWGNGG